MHEETQRQQMRVTLVLILVKPPLFAVETKPGWVKASYLKMKYMCGICD